MAVSLVGRNRTLLRTIVVVPLGRLAACPVLAKRPWGPRGAATRSCPDEPGAAVVFRRLGGQRSRRAPIVGAH